jgi:5-(carboxyamino)imidazole ribonucleotide synthase
VFPVASNVHDHGILAVSTVDIQPTPFAQRATQAALAIANGLQYQGVLCVEFFILRDGQLLVNEIAPRPHNSGHYTMNSCVTSQFEQQARVMARLPLGSTQLLTPVVMLNILGDAWYTDETDTQTEPDWSGVLAVQGASLHLYGKREARRGRADGSCPIVPDLGDVRQAHLVGKHQARAAAQGGPALRILEVGNEPRSVQ